MNGNNEIEEVKHCQTDKPRYSKELKSWDDRNIDIDHHREPSDTFNHKPIVFDIESTAEYPQRPILFFAFDIYGKKGWVGVNEEYLVGDLEPDEIKELIQNRVNKSDYEINNIKYYAHCGKQIMDDLLNYINKYNQHTAEKGVIKQKGLVAHNIFYDLGIMGEADDYLLEDGTISADEVDGAIGYNDWSIIHQRAGAYGRTYDFRKNLKPNRIPVADTQVVAKSMRKSAGLEDLCKQLNVEYEDNEDEHGSLTKDYIRYNIDDVISTGEVYESLIQTMKDSFSSDLPLSKVYSSASIGKAKLKEMGYNRAHYKEKAMSITSGAFFGGQTEALKVAEKIEEVDYTDFLSQYPTSSALLDIWRYMKAEVVDINEIDKNELPEPTVEDFKNKQTWKNVSDYYVVAKSDGALLPVRAKTNETNTTRVYKANTHHKNDGNIYHYLDVIGAKLQGGDIEIKKAWEVEKKGEQELDSTKLGGTEIDGNDNVMKRTIEERKRIQYDINDGEKDENTLALKIVANSLYGVTAERLLEKQHNIKDELKRFDVAGTYFNPHIASSITAGGRFMLTLGEIIANRNGGNLYYCDTDSLIIDSSVSEEVRNYFNDRLNPYDGKAGTLDFLEIEEKGGVELNNVDLLAVDVKKYCIMKNGKIVMDKAHGLGHYEQMRDKKDEDFSRNKRFWASLSTMLNVNTRTKKLGRDIQESIITWQTSASTMKIRKIMTELCEDNVRYGDFVKRTINIDNQGVKQYVGLDLDKKALRITHLDDGQTKFDVVEEMDKEGLKTVRDVIDEWTIRARLNKDGRRTFKITGTIKVTKEATDVVDAWDTLMIDSLPDSTAGISDIFSA